MGSSVYHRELSASCPDGWQVVPLSEVAFFQEGPGILAKDFRDHGVPLIRLKGAEGDFVTLDGCNYLCPEKVAAKWSHFQLNRGDLIISTSASFGRVSEVTEDAEGAIPYTGLIRFRPSSPQLDRSYLRAFLSSAAFMQQVEAMASGSVIRHFGPTHLKQMALFLPPLEEQRAIGQLSDLFADRLRLLRQTNVTLEAIAQALFKSWFVDFDPVRAKAEGREPEGMDAATAALFPSEFEDSELGPIPKGWRVGTLEDVSDLNASKWTTRKHPEIVKYIDLSGVNRNRIEPSAEFKFDAAPSRARNHLRDGDTIVGTVRPGNRAYAYIHAPEENLTGSTGFGVLSPKKPHLSSFVYLAATSDEAIHRLTNLADGAAYPAVRPGIVANTPCILPSDTVLAAFAEISVPMLERIVNNNTRSVSLADLRDTLLPRLISDRLRI